MKLTSRTILITGGSAGIGLAFALKFLELGNQVIVTGRRQSALDDLRRNHPKLQTIQSDVAEALFVAARQQSRESRIGIEARKAPPDDASARIDQSRRAAVADNGQVEGLSLRVERHPGSP